MADSKLLDAEVIDEVDVTDLDSVFFRPVKLTEAQRVDIEADLATLVKDAFDSRGDLDDQLAHWNDMAEGMAQPKNFPWEGSSNLFIPLTEIHLNNIHSAGRQTLLKGDQMYYVRSIGVKGDYESANKLERYINFKSLVELPIVDRFSQLIWCAERDGVGIAQVQWAVDKGEVRKLVDYPDAAKFISEYPTPEKAGISKSQYQKVMKKFVKGEKVTLMERRMETLYKGPSVNVIQLADFVMAPMTAIMTKYARLVGKIFTMSKSELKSQEENEDWNNVQEVIDTKEDGRSDLGTTLKDEIEGISRRSGKGEFVLIDGIHRYDLNGDGIDEMYLFVFHPKSGKLVYYLDYPYLHGKDCFIPVRIKKRPGRFLGRGLCQMLDDINSEVNTQHNQRVDSRTITTVPSFLCLESAKKTFDPSRKDHRFIPGRVFYVNSLNDVKQFEIRGTDMGESMNEESALMSVADQMTGSSQLRSGKETKSDPRAPAAKVNMLLNQSNVRLDDYFEEMAGCAQDNEGLNAIGEMIVDLYYQFMDEDLSKIPVLKANLQPEVDPATQQPVPAMQMSREDFYLRNRFKIQMAKTSSTMNPDALLMKFMQTYSLLINDPLIGGTPKGRLALDRRLLSLTREENPDQFLPKDEAEAAQIMLMHAQAAAGTQGGEKPGHARTRGGQTKARTPGAAGSTRPVG